ncbi:N-acetyltransferase family protein [uncultured Draconibacterium sp.]|uniref:GNAT family N-acetyltransferase n=1 Tax=uncultured Draconibacterium sp. TaxID=1573823 RepID=UPI0032161F79
MGLTIQNLEKIHWPAVSRIYQEGIDTGNATFQQVSPAWDEWDKGHEKNCRFVAVLNDELVGWAALSPVSQRCVYAGVCEISVYVANEARGQGVGKLLLQKLIDESEENGIKTLQAGIFPENTGSLFLHKKLGFREIGVREKIGQMNGFWRDVLLLEKRSLKF